MLAVALKRKMNGSLFQLGLIQILTVFTTVPLRQTGFKSKESLMQVLMMCSGHVRFTSSTLFIAKSTDIGYTTLFTVNQLRTHWSNTLDHICNNTDLKKADGVLAMTVNLKYNFVNFIVKFYIFSCSPGLMLPYIKGIKMGSTQCSIQILDLEKRVLVLDRYSVSTDTRSWDIRIIGCTDPAFFPQ